MPETKEQEAARLAAEEEAYQRNKYRQQRVIEYPQLGELADAIYWNEQGDPSKLAAYVAACEAVKAKYPKPE